MFGLQFTSVAAIVMAFSAGILIGYTAAYCSIAM